MVSHSWFRRIHPGFTKCIARARRMLPNLAHSSAPTLRAYCRQLYRTLETQVMDFLIRARWYELDATRVGLSVSAAEVQRSYEHEKARRFTTPRAFDGGKWQAASVSLPKAELGTSWASNYLRRPDNLCGAARRTGRGRASGPRSSMDRARAS